MEQTRFQEAQQAYDGGDFRMAAKLFLASAGRGADGNGAAYHMAGNSLMRLRRYQDALTVYEHALRDSLYDKRGAIRANIGAAWAALGDWAESARAYEGAIAEPDYTTPFKAYQGLAGALLERGRVEDAAIAYRKAALDPSNPDPGKALVNLGLCFMALSRPADAVESYKAALGFDEYKGRGKALSNLGLAYAALGEDSEAMRAFAKAEELHGYELTPAARTAYQAAASRSAMAGEAAADEAAVDGVQGYAAAVEAVAGATVSVPDDVAAEGDEVASAGAGEPSADGGPTGETKDAEGAPEASEDLSAVEASDAQGATFFDAEATFEGDQPAVPEAIGETPGEADTPEEAPSGGVAEPGSVDFGDQGAVSDFFSVSEEELKRRGKAERRAARARRGPAAAIRITAIVLGAVILVSGALGGAYAAGLGWPTQEQTVGGLLSAYRTGGSVDGYWVAVPSTGVAREMAKIPPITEAQIVAVTRGPKTSSVAVTVTPKDGAPLHYVITLVREGVGWKVSGIENDFSSTGG